MARSDRLALPEDPDNGPPGEVRCPGSADRAPATARKRLKWRVTMTARDGQIRKSPTRNGKLTPMGLSRDRLARYAFPDLFAR